MKKHFFLPYPGLIDFIGPPALLPEWNGGGIQRVNVLVVCNTYCI